MFLDYNVFLKSIAKLTRICKLDLATINLKPMKNLKILFAVGSLALLTACGTTKETAPITSATKTTQERGRSNQEISANTNSTTMSSSRTNSKNSTTAANRENEEARKANMEKMYADLNMTHEQIKGFENDWKSVETSWKRSHRDEAMNSYVRVEAQDKILKGVLNDTQFSQYQQWMREHAGGN